MKTRIISAFPACGKTHLFENGYNDCAILDSDSSKFSWILNKNGEPTKERNLDFPRNYINHIKSNIGKVDYIMVSSHIDVRNALDTEGLAWAYVVPDKKLMLEWVGRCYIRGNDKGFIDAMIKNWDKWTKPDHHLSPCGISFIQSGEYLKDHMCFIETLTYN